MKKVRILKVGKKGEVSDDCEKETSERVWTDGLKVGQKKTRVWK